MSELTFTLSEAVAGNSNENRETEKAIGNVPLQANYVTNIRGEFSNYTNKAFNVTTNSDWNAEEQNVAMP